VSVSLRGSHGDGQSGESNLKFFWNIIISLEESFWNYKMWKNFKNVIHNHIWEKYSFIW
jgi:hypothetical protein